MPLYSVLIDFTKALYTVSREWLWKMLKMFECTEKVVNLISSLRDGKQAQVVQGQPTSNELPVMNGIKQRCVLAPTMFSLISTCERVYIQTRHNTNLFRASQFKSKTRTTKYLVREMLFADDSALVARSAEDIQLFVDYFSRAATHLSWRISIRKTERLCQSVKLLKPPPELTNMTTND